RAHGQHARCERCKPLREPIDVLVRPAADDEQRAVGGEVLDERLGEAACGVAVVRPVYDDEWILANDFNAAGPADGGEALGKRLFRKALSPSLNQRFSAGHRRGGIFDLVFAEEGELGSQDTVRPLDANVLCPDIMGDHAPAIFRRYINDGRAYVARPLTYDRFSFRICLRAHDDVATGRDDRGFLTSYLLNCIAENGRMLE